jgi:uncharacterized protein YneF (UPF0154 family)
MKWWIWLIALVLCLVVGVTTRYLFMRAGLPWWLF